MQAMVSLGQLMLWALLWGVLCSGPASGGLCSSSSVNLPQPSSPPAHPFPRQSPAGSAVNVPGSQEWCGWGRAASHSLSVDLAGWQLVLQHRTSVTPPWPPSLFCSDTCEPGFFSASSGQTTCTACPAGQITVASGENGATGCTGCSRGTWRAANATDNKCQRWVLSMHGAGWLRGCVCKPVAARLAARPELRQQQDAIASW